jgi:membrane protein involved in D-alanine export
MSFKYYAFALLMAFIFQTNLLKIQKKQLLFLLNSIILVLVFFDSKKHLLFLITHITLVFGLCLCLQSTKANTRKFFAVITLIASFFPLAFFKYTFPQAMTITLFPHAARLLQPATFIGISFYTFRISSFVIDLTYGRIKKINFCHLYNFVLFFPTLLSGPIDRYLRFISDVESDNKTEWKEYYNAMFRIAWGVFKKIVIADALWNFSNDSYGKIELYQLPIWKILIGQYAYYLMLYFDFSGYSDVAIGISNLFGIKTPENFNKPWKARNIQIFWNSWHISFMNWLRDYIFFPLQNVLMRLGVSNIPINNSLSYFATFLIAGIWHGEEKRFIYYGIFHGTGFILYFTYKRLFEKYLSKDERKSYLKNKKIEFTSRFLTFHFFLLSLFFFIDKGEFFSIIINKVSAYVH